jgi:hypothetical protein
MQILRIVGQRIREGGKSERTKRMRGKSIQLWESQKFQLWESQKMMWRWRTI